MQDQVDDLFCKVMGTSVTCASAKRISTKAAAAQGLVVGQFKDKNAVFQARGKLRGNSVGMDDETTCSKSARLLPGLPLKKQGHQGREHSGKQRSCLSWRGSALSSNRISSTSWQRFSNCTEQQKPVSTSCALKMVHTFAVNIPSICLLW